MNASTSAPTTIAVLGGTGNEGGGLALRWAHVGHKVIIGSRTAERAKEAADKFGAIAGKPIEGLVNKEAAAKAEIVVLAVPYAAQASTANDVAAEIQGKILIDVTVPLMPPKVARVQLPEGGSAVDALQKKLGAGVKVVSAFQNVSAHQLMELGHSVDCDVLVCGDDEAARERVVQLAKDAGMVAWQAGPLANSAAAEALTSVLISINKRYKVADGAGIRITGIN
jgi:8-hydroxy-5-deazaflavin:NADPH oxidoreductase